MSTLTLENVGPVQSLAIECPEDGGLVVLRGRNGAGKIPQDAFEGLDPPARLAIHEHLKSRRVVAVTAESSADEQIVAEEFNGT